MQGVRISTIRNDPRDDLDEIVYEHAGGHYVVPLLPNAPRYNIRNLDEYCEKNGRRPEDLSNTELQQFRTN